MSAEVELIIHGEAPNHRLSMIVRDGEVEQKFPFAYENHYDRVVWYREQLLKALGRLGLTGIVIRG